MRLERKVVVGHWADAEVQDRIGAWTRAACARHDWETRADRPVRRQHARGRGHRGRQGRGPAPARLQRQRLRRRRPRRGRRRGDRRRGRRPDRDLPRRVRRRARAAARWRASRRRCATAPASRSACAGFLDDGGFIAFTTTFEDLHGLAQLPGLGRPAADARRLRLRRRGRLEDRGDGPGDEGHVRRACPAACRSWRTTPTT